MSLFTINVVPSNDGQIVPSQGGASATAISLSSARRREMLMDLSAYFAGLANGSFSGTVDVQRDTSVVTPNYLGGVGAGSVAASGTLTLSSASGTVGGTINGVAITVTASGGDTVTAAAIAAAINASANALIAGIVTATSVGPVVTVASAIKGTIGNTITLAQSGTGVTASGARLAGGVNASANVL